LLHFNYRDTGISRDEILEEVIKKLKARNPKVFSKLTKKNIKEEEFSKKIFYELLSEQNKAIKFSEKLLAFHGSSHNPEEDNPSTTIHKLVELLNSLGKNNITKGKNMKQTFKIRNVKCGGCAKTLKTKLDNNFDNVTINLEVEPREVTLDINSEDIDKLKMQLREVGYPMVDDELSIMQNIQTKTKSFVSCAIGKIDNMKE
jgi:copper chaperone CopZ